MDVLNPDMVRKETNKIARNEMQEDEIEN